MESFRRRRDETGNYCINISRTIWKKWDCAVRRRQHSFVVRILSSRNSHRKPVHVPRPLGSIWWTMFRHQIIGEPREAKLRRRMVARNRGKWRKTEYVHKNIISSNLTPLHQGKKKAYQTEWWEGSRDLDKQANGIAITQLIYSMVIIQLTWGKQGPNNTWNEEQI